MKEQEKRQKKRIKRGNECINPSEGQAEPGPIIPIEQFTELLRELARGRDIDCRRCVSMQGMVEKADEIFKLIVGPL